ncbi:hypothetical protein [Aneurinibacillus terranovensis]|uniref:hypothetical protein n=1 Tax=Aneurinibacillus terranovensis TaxID=278991 RepID=UPI0004245C4B|nr:hypothetical protein [Aneurinibacillus terranovensis]
MPIENALLNYLQIKIVADARPDDTAARNTSDFFYSILVEDHKLEALEYTRDDTMYHVRYTAGGKQKTRFLDRLAVEQLLASIQAEPRYGE